MPEQTPYVVDNRWIVYANNTMEATAKFREQHDPNKWPIVRQANLDDLTRLATLTATKGRVA